MNELTIKYVPAEQETNPTVCVSCRLETGAQSQEHSNEFLFTISDEQRQHIQWYLEKYLLFPWGEFRTRARETEAMMAWLGEEMFEAIFSSRETNNLYGNVANELGDTRIVIHASDPEGIVLPWELLRDPTRGEYGDLARLAYAFVRIQSDSESAYTIPILPMSL